MQLESLRAALAHWQQEYDKATLALGRVEGMGAQFAVAEIRARRRQLVCRKFADCYAGWIESLEKAKASAESK